MNIDNDFFQYAGADESSKRKIFITNIKEDISNYINQLNRINILPDQIIITKVYSGSIIIDLKIIPDSTTGISITKEYFSYIFSNPVTLPNVGVSTDGTISNVKIISWFNIEHWPEWIWYVIVITLTTIILFAILI